MTFRLGTQKNEEADSGVILLNVGIKLEHKLQTVSETEHVHRCHFCVQNTKHITVIHIDLYTDNNGPAYNILSLAIISTACVCIASVHRKACCYQLSAHGSPHIAE